MIKKITVSTVLIILATALARQYMIGNYISLGSAPALAGSVSQSMYGGTAKTKLLIAGKDFELQGVNYFDNNGWAVAKVSSLNKTFDSGIVVLQKLNGTYVVVLGPGSFFDISFLQSIPTDVGQYLTALGVIHGPSS